jgi:glyoxylase-like metal-dependent hydrolase (beta-lactamase superfamily II)
MQTYEDGTLRIRRFGPLGPFTNNAYIIEESGSGEAVIVDMPMGSEELLAAIQGLQISGILLTHTHSDHWAAYELVKEATGAPVLCHPAETMMPAEMIDRPLADGTAIPLGELTIQAIHTPGHTPGSTCFLVGCHLISGDTMFPGGPGRTGSPEDLREIIGSITQRLYVLPDETLVLPGHGDDTTIARSKAEYADFISRPHPDDLSGDVLWQD